MMAFETIRLQKYVGLAGAARAMLGGFVVVLAIGVHFRKIRINAY